MGIFDDLLGKSSANASNAAAGDTYSKLMAASGDLTNYGNQYRADYSNLAQQYQPYQQAGGDALKMIMSGLGLSGGEGSQAYTDAYRATPGYQAGLETGTNAVTAGANAGNMLNSGKTLKSLQRFGSDYEDQRSQQYLQNLFGLQGQGLQATNSAVSTEGQGLQGQLATRQGAYQGQVSAAPVVGQGMVAGEQAKQGALTNLMNLGGQIAGIGLGTNWGRSPLPARR
jgi:hypothetical protein